MRTMRRCGALLFALAALIAMPANAQSPAGDDGEKRELALKLLAVTKAVEIVVQSMESSLPAQRAASPELPGEFWDTLLVRAKAGADSLTRMLVPVFTEAYTVEELRGLLAFYESPLGRRVVQQQPIIMTRSTEIGQQWGMTLGFEVAQEMLRAGRLGPPPD